MSILGLMCYNCNCMEIPLVEFYRELLSNPNYEIIFNIIGYGFNIFIAFAFIWAPHMMWVILRDKLIILRKKECLKKMDFKVLEIRIPKDVDKSPLAMEIVLQSLHQPFKPQNYFDQIFKGKVNSWFSLEMVSTEGAIRFFIFTPKEFAKLVSTHIYSQYPNVEINEVEDYVTKVPYGRDKEDWDMFGTEFKLTKADPYPIKTYVDYGLDKLGIKEEFKIDPLTVIMEYLGSIGRNQHAWIQIVIRAHETRYKGSSKPKDWNKYFSSNFWWKVTSADFWKFWTNDWWTPPLQDWKKEADKMVSDIKAKGDKMTNAQRKEIEAIERSMTKLGFDVGIRALYLAKKEYYDSSNIAGLLSILKQFSSLELNGFEGNGKAATKTDPKVDKDGSIAKSKKKKMFNSYLKRNMFYFQKDSAIFVLNTEELATIFHFPGKVSSTPTFSRIESQKAEPPSNLPI